MLVQDLHTDVITRMTDSIPCIEDKQINQG